jgi:single-strand DNA-binding protein
MSAIRSLNKAMLIGNLTRDPELKETTTGSKICTFGLATNSSYRKKDGTEEKMTEFHNIVAWNKLAEICNDILKKGMLVYLEGEMRTRNWESEGGEVRYRTDVRIDEMKLLDNKGMLEEVSVNEEDTA